MTNKALLTLALFAAVPGMAAAQAHDWTGTGELGIAMTRGNTKSDNANGKLAFAAEDAQWKHAFYLSALRNRAEVVVDGVGGQPDQKLMQTSANRYEAGASSAMKLNEVSSWVSALRYENDDFAPYENQLTFSIGYGHKFINNDRSVLLTEVGPGYRRAKDASTGETESDLIGRGLLDFKHGLTDSTTLYNTLLVETGKDNTFASNELGIAVAINDRFALKTGYDVRHNSKVGVGTKKTDTMAKVNLVYNFK